MSNTRTKEDTTRFSVVEFQLLRYDKSTDCSGSELVEDKKLVGLKEFHGGYLRVDRLFQNAPLTGEMLTDFFRIFETMHCVEGVRQFHPRLLPWGLNGKLSAHVSTKVLANASGVNGNEWASPYPTKSSLTEMRQLESRRRNQSVSSPDRSTYPYAIRCSSVPVRS